jgi:ABC-type amino acid transport substrate-binding protein
MSNKLMGLRLRRILFAVLLCLITLTAYGQQAIPFVPLEQLNRTRPLNESNLRFCVWQNSPLREFEELLAVEIANALLLKPVIKIIGRVPPTNDNDFWEAIYLALSNECDALLGHILVSNQLSDWLTASRPYYSTPAVLAVSGSYANLGSVPAGALIGSQLTTAVDNQFLRYLSSAGNRWRRLPYDSVPRMVDDLTAGTIAGALVQEAALYAALDFEPTEHGISTVSIRPLADAATDFAILYLSSESSLRTILDGAILALQQDGVIKDLAGQSGLPPGL